MRNAGGATRGREMGVGVARRVQTRQTVCLQQEIPPLFVLASGATRHHAESRQPTGQVPVGRFSVNIRKVFVSPEVD